MTTYSFDADYDHELQERAARIIMRRDTGQGRSEAANALASRAGAARQAGLDFAIRITLDAFPKVEYTVDEMAVLTAALWSVDDSGCAVPPSPFC